jgi:hypothetical protein
VIGWTRKINTAAHRPGNPDRAIGPARCGGPLRGRRSSRHPADRLGVVLAVVVAGQVDVTTSMPRATRFSPTSTSTRWARLVPTPGMRSRSALPGDAAVVSAVIVLRSVLVRMTGARLGTRRSGCGAAVIATPVVPNRRRCPRCLADLVHAGRALTLLAISGEVRHDGGGLLLVAPAASRCAVLRDRTRDPVDPSQGSNPTSDMKRPRSSGDVLTCRNGGLSRGFVPARSRRLLSSFATYDDLGRSVRTWRSW